MAWRKKYCTDNKPCLNVADIWDVGLLLLGGCMVAVSVNLFLAPARIPDGTMLLLGIIAQHLFGLVLGTAMLLLRILGLFFGFRYLGPWPVLLRTGFTALVVTFAIDLSAERFALVSANLILTVLYGGALSGLGMGLISAAAAIPGAPVCTRAFCSWLLVGR